MSRILSDIQNGGWQKYVSYITLSEEKAIEYQGCTIPAGFQMPIMTEDFMEYLDNGNISWDNFARGIMYVLVNEPHHPDLKVYSDFLRAVDPRLEEHLLREGTKLVNEGEYLAALEYLVPLAAIAPDLCDAHYYVGLCYYELARTALQVREFSLHRHYCQLAEEAFERLTNLNKNAALAYYYLGALANLRRDEERAKTFWKTSLNLGLEPKMANEIRNKVGA